MATNRNDDMNRNNKTNNPQASDRSSSQGGLTPSHTSQGSTGQGNMGSTGRDNVNRDREMNRDTEVGQGSSGSGQSGRDSFGSTDKSRGTGSDVDRSRTTGTDTSRDRDRGPSDISE